MKIAHQPQWFSRFAIPCLVVLSTLLACGCAVAITWVLAPKAATPSVPVAKQQSAAPVHRSASSFDMSRYSPTNPANFGVVVNKAHRIAPVDYAPSNLAATAEGVLVDARILPDLNAMIAAARAQGVMLPVVSGYRSYANQVTLYNNYVAQYGQAATDAISAHPGHSEHQLGLAVDLGTVSNGGCSLNPCFGDTIEGQWIAAHSYEYGFIVRYTAANTAITGYDPEGWHVRYVGHDLAIELRKRQISTLEQFFGVSGGSVYTD